MGETFKTGSLSLTPGHCLQFLMIFWKVLWFVWNIYPLHTLYQVEPVIWTSITTSVMLLVYATGKTWYKVLYQHTMYVISLLHFNICNKFITFQEKRIPKSNKGRFKINKFVQYSELDYILCMTSRYLLPFIHQCHVNVRSLSVSLYNRPTTLFYLKKGEPEILKLCPWKW